MTLLPEKLSTSILSAKDGDLVIVKYQSDNFLESDIEHMRPVCASLKDSLAKTGKNVEVAFLWIDEQSNMDITAYPNYEAQLSNLLTAFTKYTPEQRRSLASFMYDISTGINDQPQVVS